MLSERLVYFRKKNKLTQNDVAYRLNVVRSTYTNWEAGRSEPDVSTLIKLSDIYNVSLDNLVGRGYRMPPQFEVILDQISDLDTEPKKKALNLLVEYTYLIKKYFM
ncbi:helix-turn-helix transcriptional regulator [Bacillus thuringiensis]|uniref:helix-turn-helix domain-containing protein n=1 Tax=Bacillus thuringiensis TaxID=1428 RepID=UPI002DBE8A47|nr:helix-turn-helix transcriptional regulator [Bacillus thuringiensis]MEC3228185.1 helix-turn-helix transcriptional regulator [Bacillus thuringiensis]MEC3484725.1 helix-turn-helix transcriptional regulator [Bacillus thuringiensis]MED2067892.1 helix-turn-helix transcriptional regulator [Bacillus thuringiensis]MED2191759.1 helix-turn-helix transcriptional regulator [Bacillus thuringiensis]MED2213159.1 helix-turn-helix transcriptional regulator [Bacillus thuringiensis]